LAITNLDRKPHSPEILASIDEARAIALMIPGGESFDDHQVHENAWVTVIDGEVEITTSNGESLFGSSGLLLLHPQRTSRRVQMKRLGMRAGRRLSARSPELASRPH
jgi:hypothetical protein